MKFYNKKKILRSDWTKVVPANLAIGPRPFLRDWCKQQESDGRFYYYYGSPAWWFEKPEDASHFLLRWSC